MLPQRKLSYTLENICDIYIYILINSAQISKECLRVQSETKPRRKRYTEVSNLIVEVKYKTHKKQNIHNK